MCATPQEELGEKRHCAVGVFSWWVKLVKPSAPHEACSGGSELWSGWHQRPPNHCRQYHPTLIIPIPAIDVLVAQGEDVRLKVGKNYCFEI